MIEFAVIPTRAIRLLQMQHRDRVPIRERFDRATEPVPDLLEQHR
jgi:hypothetical protein